MERRWRTLASLGLVNMIALLASCTSAADPPAEIDEPDGPAPSEQTATVSGADGSMTQVHTFQQFAEDNQVLSFKPETPLTEIQYVRVMTTHSPSWVAWKEIEVIEE